MNVLVLDVENSVTHKEFTNRNGDVKKHVDLSAWNPNNFLVSVGMQWAKEDTGHYICVKHNEQPYTDKGNYHIQGALDETTLLVGHNIKHDMEWLTECGFKYDGALWCTQIAEYVMMRGIKGGLSLKALAIKHDLTRKKTDLTEEYLAQGIGFDAMPWEIVEEYGRGDVTTTLELYKLQVKRLEEKANKGLMPTIKMMNAFTYPIMEMEKNGLKVDFDELDRIKIDYVKEHNELRVALTDMAQAVIGDTPVRLTSNDFMSELLYSRKVKDKVEWKDVFNIKKDANKRELPRTRMNKSMFNKQVRSMTTVTRQTSVKACSVCNSRGSYYKTKKDGQSWKNPTTCKMCLGEGVVYIPVNKVAGFRVIPRGTKDLTAHGFKADSDTVEELISGTIGPAKEFIEKYSRYNAVSTYIATYIEGIERYIGGDGVLHTSLNQTITATGRLSSSGPNLHNQPRGNTFPIRRAFVSRFEGGSILKADYGQLEFRVAGYLSGCPVIRKDIDDGVDAHKMTADIIFGKSKTPEEFKLNRQNAKAHTFKPLYGGMSGEPTEVAYYMAFIKKFSGIAAWHKVLKVEAINTKKVVLPSGREYAFPYAERLKGGYVKGTTQIVNYPVQGFATGDLVPLGVLSVWRRMKARPDLKSLMVITVHDDDEIDVYPGEEKEIEKIVIDGLLDLPAMCKEFYGLDFEYPIEVEVSIGPNLLNQKEIAKESRV